MVSQRALLVFVFALSSLASCGEDDTSSSAAGGTVSSASGGEGFAMGGAPSLGGRGPEIEGGASAGTYGVGGQPGDTTEGGAGGGGEAGALGEERASCSPARTKYPLPARAALYGAAEASFSNVVLVAQLVERFDGYCAGCHRAPNSQGNFSYTSENFGSVVDQRALERIRAVDDSMRMPPLSPPLSGGPLGELAELLELWLAQGRPSLSIKLPNSATSVASDSAYGIDGRTGRAYTNLGNCIPSAALVGTKPDDMDARFSAMQSFEDLPKKLSQTDLFTLDSEELARHNTIAFAPNYQLWSFDAGKLRYIHLPRGEHVQFQKSTPNHFRIPENTRFYKTFLKPVVDKSGKTGWRKMETRLIVSRKAQLRAGKKVDQALFATYVWNSSETEATLLEKPYFDNAKFKDEIQRYVADERIFKSTLESSDQSGPVILRQLDGTKEYPVPGAHRCVQCHMGAESGDYVLGFTPYQINRRPLGEGGSYEASGDDDLTQVERLIEYGIVAGVKNVNGLPKLEDSGGTRRPRNQYELRAQAYIYGNCGHCHNPNGYPTKLNPGLAPLNFQPGGVVFQFPLDMASPLRIRAGKGLKYLNPDLSVRDRDVTHSPPANPLPLAPWDSLVYRNTQTPATYDEDNIIYPHMPMHVGGIDCRAQHFLGSWNASIPYQAKSATDLTKIDSDLPEAAAQADQRVATFLAQMPSCSPADDLRDWGAKGADFTDLQPPWGIPDRPHFFEEDFSESYGDFQPRGANFRTAMLQPSYRFILDFRPSDELVEFVRTDFPFDFWAEKPECDFSRAPAFTGTVEHWMQEAGALTEERGRRIYKTLPGAATFEAICSNCHGSRGDAQSNLASSIATLTGGQTRVANYSQGLFGPPSNPTANLAYFEREPLADGTYLGADGAAKYLMWMALGGTQALIPPAALRQVAAAKVAAHTRQKLSDEFASANMLQIALEICGNTVQYNTSTEQAIGLEYDLATGDPAKWSNARSSLLAVIENGEYPLYKRLCAIDNPRPVRMIYFSEHHATVSGHLDRSVFTSSGAAWSGTDDAPYCYDPESFEEEVPVGFARCPQRPTTGEAAMKWARRGALNVGYGVYDYLKRAFQDPSEWRPRYDQCEVRYPAK